MMKLDEPSTYANSPRIDMQIAGDPIFSVVIPTYNRARELDEALKSVLSQTCTSFEIIIVDNNSSDTTKPMVNSYNDPRITFTQVKNNGVIGYSRNVGIQNTTAPLVAFLDDDDIWYPDKLEKVLEVWMKTPNIGLVCHDEYVSRDSKIVEKLTYGPYQQDMYKALLLQGCKLSPSATVVHRHWLEQVGGFSEDPCLTSVEDYDLWLRLSIVCAFHFLHEPLGEFRIHPRTTSPNSGVNPVSYTHLTLPTNREV